MFLGMLPDFVCWVVSSFLNSKNGYVTPAAARHIDFKTTCAKQKANS